MLSDGFESVDIELDVKLFGWEDSLLGGSCELRFSDCFSFESDPCAGQGFRTNIFSTILSILSFSVEFAALSV